MGGSIGIGWSVTHFDVWMDPPIRINLLIPMDGRMDRFTDSYGWINWSIQVDRSTDSNGWVDGWMDPIRSHKKKCLLHPLDKLLIAIDGSVHSIDQFSFDPAEKMDPFVPLTESSAASIRHATHYDRSDQIRQKRKNPPVHLINTLLWCLNKARGTRLLNTRASAIII
jgi:hypothetical protein